MAENTAAVGSLLARRIADVAEDLRDADTSALPWSQRRSANIQPLLLLKEYCDRNFAFAAPPSECLVSLFISLLVADLFTNLYADTPYTPAVERARQDFLPVAVEGLAELAETIERNDEAGAFRALARITHGYACLIKRLNELEETSYE